MRMKPLLAAIALASGASIGWLVASGGPTPSLYAQDKSAKDAPAKDAPAKDAPAKDAPAKDKQPPAKEPEAPAGDEYRQFFKKPQTAMEFWKGIQFELEVGRPDLAAGYVTGPDGISTLAPDVALGCFYQDCDPATAAWATARLGLQSLASLQQQPYAVAWRTKPSTYVVCANDEAIHPSLQRILARRCITTAEWPTGHTPFLSRPDLIAALLADLAARPHGAECAR